MDLSGLQQLRGAVELLTAAVDAGVREIAKAHHAMTHWPYAWIVRLPGASFPARAIEAVQYAVTATVYGAVRALSRLIGTATIRVLGLFDAEVAGEPG